MALFKKPSVQGAPISPQQSLLQRYNGSRNNLLLVVAFTLVNMVLLIAGSSSYFLFSASIPYYLTFFGMLYTGKMPADYYYEWTDFEPAATSFLVIMIAISVILTAVYALCWFLSKKRGFGWLVFALISFVVDTIFMFVFVGFSADMIIDVVFHVWVIISLASGISAAVKLTKLPPEEPATDMQVGVPTLEQQPDYTAISTEAASAPTEQVNELPTETVNDIPKED